MSKNANLSLHLVAIHKQSLPRAELDRALREANAQGRPLEDLLRAEGQIPGEELDKLLALRQRHGRRCAACGKTTYLLPKQTEQNTPCEHCQDKLEPGPAPAPERVRSPSGRILRPLFKTSSGRLETSPKAVSPTDAPRAEAPLERRRPPARPDGAPAAAPAGGDGGGSSSGPAQPASPERARQLRLAGGGFGYEPMEPEAPLGKRPGAAASPATPAPGPSGPDAQPPADDARFAPPADDARFAPPADDARFAAPAGDSRFAPPAAHRAAPTIEQAPPPPARPLREEVGLVLAYPFRGPEGAALLGMGALFFSLLQLVPVYGLLLVGSLLTYPTAYLVTIAEEAMRGRTELPSWPEFNPLELLYLALRMALALLSGMLPFALAWGLLLLPQGYPPDMRTIGPDAHLSASATPNIAPGTPVGEASFLALDGQTEVRAGGGTWTVLGLLGRDTADDTGMDQMMANLPRGGFGVLIFDGWQAYDLDRVGRALGRDRVRVLGAYADPAEKVMRANWPFLAPPEEEPAPAPAAPDPIDEGDDEEGGGEAFPRPVGVDETLHKAMDKAAEGTRGVTMAGPEAMFAPPEKNPFLVLELIKTRELVFPAPFAGVKRLPCVYVIDPQGRVAREYATGVHDEKLYADLLNLMAGGRGDTWPKRLPPQVLGLSGGPGPVSYGLVALLYLAGLFYTPMALLLTVGFTSALLAFNYPAGLRAIQASLPDYVTLFALLCGVSLLVLVAQLGAEWALRLVIPSPMIGGALAWFASGVILFYGLTVQAFGIGRYYWGNQGRLAWFRRQ